MYNATVYKTFKLISLILRLHSQVIRFPKDSYKFSNKAFFDQKTRREEKSNREHACSLAVNELHNVRNTVVF